MPRSLRTRLRPGVAALALALAGGSVACQAGSDGENPDPSQHPHHSQYPPENQGARDDVPGPQEPERAENVIFIVGDGMGIAHRELIRLTTVGHEGELAMNQLQYQGWTRTEPADPDRAVTDSAAAATALAAGVRTAAGAIGVDVDQNPVPTLLERAQEAGMATGLVTTSRVTDATPAAFAAHVADRDDHGEIARQYLEETHPQVILGGGGDQWYPAGSEGVWPDKAATDPTETSSGTAANLVDRAEQFGYQYVSNAAELAEIEDGMLLGLFANEEMFTYADDLEPLYEPAVPLVVMADKALQVLSRNQDGFFLVIEEEGIDAMAHRGDAQLMIEAGRALDETVALARDFADEHAGTLIVVVGDHETGGLAIESIPVGDEAEETEPTENGPFTVAGTDLKFDVEWTTGGHTAAATPASAEGPGAEAMVDVRANTDIHDLVLDAMQVDQR